jgi:pimeloyl-ACP methyl ester carboxylesterase
LIPLLEWLPGYRRDWLRTDVVAGLTTAAVVIPKSMAYATVAGLPIQVGLYTAFIPMLVYALLGTSRPLSVSTSTTLAILTAAQLGEVAQSGDPAVLLHATGFLARLWEPIAVTLAARYRVYAYDARGHGDSDKPAVTGAEGSASGYGWEGLAARAKEHPSVVAVLLVYSGWSAV